MSAFFKTTRRVNYLTSVAFFVFFAGGGVVSSAGLAVS